jgi:hypothetical protein
MFVSKELSVVVSVLGFIESAFDLGFDCAQNVIVLGRLARRHFDANRAQYAAWGQVIKGVAIAAALLVVSVLFALASFAVLTVKAFKGDSPAAIAAWDSVIDKPGAILAAWMLSGANQILDKIEAGLAVKQEVIAVDSQPLGGGVEPRIDRSCLKSSRLKGRSKNAVAIA